MVSAGTFSSDFLVAYDTVNPITFIQVKYTYERSGLVTFCAVLVLSGCFLLSRVCLRLLLWRLNLSKLDYAFMMSLQRLVSGQGEQIYRVPIPKFEGNH